MQFTHVACHSLKNCCPFEQGWRNSTHIVNIPGRKLLKSPYGMIEDRLAWKCNCLPCEPQSRGGINSARLMHSEIRDCGALFACGGKRSFLPAPNRCDRCSSDSRDAIAARVFELRQNQRFNFHGVFHDFQDWEGVFWKRFEICLVQIFGLRFFSFFMVSCHWHLGVR